jgi:repressor LexA
MRPLTKRQELVLDFVKAAIESTGFPPTRNEIAEGFGWKSANSAEEHLQALARKQYLDLTPGVSRGIRLRERS